MSKVRNKKRILLGLLAFLLALVLVCGIAPTKASAMNDVDLSDSLMAITTTPQVIDSNLWILKDTKVFGIDSHGAYNHAKVHSDSMYDGLGTTVRGGYIYFHPKGSKYYNGKYGHKAYTLMDDTRRNQNCFKMLEVEDKSGDSGKSLRGTSKFYDGKNPWQQFEFVFVSDNGRHDLMTDYSSYVLHNVHCYTVKVLAEKSGKALYYDPNSNRLRVGWDSDNTLGLLVYEDSQAYADGK